MQVLVQAHGLGDMHDLRRRVTRWEMLGIDGVVVTDHLFVRTPDRSTPQRAPDPFVVLAAIAALSDRLKLGTFMANIGFAHPALTFRHAAQLAALVGGRRVLAGIGAGWNAEEFEALGLVMPRFADRMDRLEEAASLARHMFHMGAATVTGEHASARDLPLSPTPMAPPLLMLGGGSARMLDIAARHADHLDLNGSSRRQPIGRSSALRDNAVRRLSTTVGDLEESATIVRRRAVAAGRDSFAVDLSVFVDVVLPCLDEDVPAVTADLCRERGAGPRDLSDCPYVLIGSRDRMRRAVKQTVETLGLSTLILRDGDHLEWMLPEILGISNSRGHTSPDHQTQEKHATSAC